MTAFVKKPDANRIYWINNASTVDWFSLQTAPLHVGPMMEQYIWNAKESVILTSATLQSAGGFEYLRERLYANDAKELALDSPFNYKDSTLIFIPDDIPEPSQQGYQRAVEKGIIELAATLNGRVLALFTSYTQLRETAANYFATFGFGQYHSL